MAKRLFLCVFLFSFLFTLSPFTLSFADSREKFEQAAARGDIKTVRKLLKQIDFKDEQYYDAKNIALGLAAEKGHVKTMRLLMDSGAQVNAAPDPYDETALMQAAGAGQIKAMRLLLDRGAKINIFTYSGHSALIMAAANGHLETVKFLLQHKADINANVWNERQNYIDANGGTALFYAAANGHIAVAKWLLENGANVHLPARDGTALMAASANKHLAMVKLLLQHGARVNDRVNFDTKETEYGDSALILAAEAGAKDIVELLLKHGAHINATASKKRPYFATALMKASVNGHTDVVKLLLKHGADTTIKNSTGRTALMLAQAYGYEEIALLLGGSKENVHIVTKDDNAPYPIQWEETLSEKLYPRGIYSLRALLLQHPHNFNTTYGESALINAILGDYIESTELLLEHGAYADREDIFGYTPLILASARQNAAIVKLLLAKNAHVDIMDAGGNTALAHAAWKGNVEIMQLLLDAKASINAQIPKEQITFQAAMTPLMFACMEKNPEAVKLLLDNGANVDLVDKWGDTALIHALEPTRWKLFGENSEDEGYTYSRLGPSRQKQIWPQWFRGNASQTNPQYAKLPINTEIVQLLLKHGAKVNAKALDMVKETPELKVLLAPQQISTL